MNPICRELWLLFKQHPLIGFALTIEIGFGYVLEFVSPKLSLWLAERELRRVDARLLTLRQRK